MCPLAKEPASAPVKEDDSEGLTDSLELSEDEELLEEIHHAAAVSRCVPDHCALYE